MNAQPFDTSGSTRAVRVLRWIAQCERLLAVDAKLRARVLGMPR